ncbi:MAG: LytTR family DNA-binding domain-containing protein [Sulfurospirillaceae bacterium]|nr:LytTR family DNA-binding domain-containing protein [Sulfurospirillaceae bacterium]MDD2826208.1 LytTR family DNA-binding domain-containing protein [Sulfurospirillaceae bacterium]
MKILVMDDESLALSRVERLLKELNYSSTCVSTLENFDTECAKTSFNIFILDINMPQISGIELAKKILLKQPDAFIIFQTAYEEFALKAYQIGAIDYLLKPFDKETLERSINRALAYRKENNITFLSKNGDETYLINQKDIFYIEANLSEVIIKTKEHFSYIDEKISQMETLLDSELFFRIHRSYIVNINKIKYIKTVEQSKLEFFFEGINDVVISSKDGAKKFREKYKEIQCK